MTRRFLTADDVRRAGGREIVVDQGTVVTPQAQEVAAQMGVAIRTGSGAYSEPEPDRGPDAEKELAHLSHMPEPSDDFDGTGVVVTCVGRNRPGVLGEVTGVIGEHGSSINDVSQKMVGEYFHLVIVAELGSTSSFNVLKGALEDLGARAEYVVRVMHERVFRFMHRV
ncbi:MAG: ACT domain-containing protein [Planctomycetota bacterium]|jgi:ACT domain-containing protein